MLLLQVEGEAKVDMSLANRRRFLQELPEAGFRLRVGTGLERTLSALPFGGALRESNSDERDEEGRGSHRSPKVRSRT